VATALLNAGGGLHGLARAGPDDLMRTGGIGLARASQIVAAIEIGRRTLARPPGERWRIQQPRDAAEYLMPRFGARSAEQFGVVLLDTKCRVLRVSVLTVGTTSQTGVEPREVFREAMMGGASAIVAFHNHPSGDPSPSPEDVDLTRRLAAAGALMGIDLVDHVVLGDGRYWSFKEMRQL
jgi:DNA repair protein RadC